MSENKSKDALKELRQQRKFFVERAKKSIKQQNRKIAAIKAHLKTQPATVPELAAALRMETADVLITVTALRKYGEVAEGDKAGDYFKYQLA